MTTGSPGPEDPEVPAGPEVAADLDEADPWPAILQLAEMVNELALRTEDHEARLGPRLPVVADTDLEEWVGWLSAEYGLHGLLGDRDRWAATPPVRNELIALRLASAVLTTAKPGSFEPVYWHDALARVVDRIPGHYGRWATNQTSLQAASRANGRTSQVASQ